MTRCDDTPDILLWMLFCPAVMSIPFTPRTVIGDGNVPRTMSDTSSDSVTCSAIKTSSSIRIMLLHLVTTTLLHLPLILMI